MTECPVEFCNGGGAHHKVKKFWQYVRSFRHNTTPWQTERRTDRSGK